MAKGLEMIPEGGERCFKCYELRLREAAKLAKEGDYDYFTTTLSISPLKNAQKLNEIGERLAGEYGVAYLVSDFKKRNGYKRSTELSKIYGLYRQDYCGCIYSKIRENGKETSGGRGSSVKVKRGTLQNPTFYGTLKHRITLKKRGKAMAQLWGGRFTKETDKLVYNFNASISFDKRFYEQDIQGSKAHVMMLAKQEILTDDEKQQILDGLESIRRDVESGKLEITGEYEDIHSFVEANLIDRIGDAGKKLHTGRSRNDQVALDMKLYTRSEITALQGLVVDMLRELLAIMKDNTETIMPGFTHLQKAQPITLAHHMVLILKCSKETICV